MTIQILPARLANQIAAGEVVERPASVIKELVENALDAGASRIDIDIEKGGAKLIRVRDNGGGIAKDQLTLALSRHATSKITNFDDLENITSLGFRGEALASISSVARLTLTSRPAEQSEAWQAYAEGRDMAVKIIPAAHPVGTTIEVHDLFFNTPARRKFLRSDKTEFQHIDELIKRIALSRFEVQFNLTHNGKSVRRLPAINHIEQRQRRVAQLCGQPFVERSVSVHSDNEALLLRGWLTTADYCRNQADVQYCYVNGRMMRDKLLNHAIRQAYAELLPAGVYPGYLLYLELDPRQMDVNVHPAKHEVRFHQARLVHDFVVQALQQVLQPSDRGFDLVDPSLSAAVDQSGADVHGGTAQQAGAYDGSFHNAEQGNRSEFAVPHQLQSSRAPSRGQHQARYLADKPSGKELQQYRQTLAQFSQLNSVDETEHTATSEAQPFAESSSPFQAQTQVDPPSQAEGVATQIEGGGCLSVLSDHFVLYQQGQQLFLLDLRQVNARVAAHQYAEGLVAQPLLLPVKLTLQSTQQQLVNWVILPEVVEYFSCLGIQYQCNQKTVVIKKVPAVLRQQNVADCVLSLFEYGAAQQLQQWSVESSIQLLYGRFIQLAGFELSQAVSLVQQLQQFISISSILNDCAVTVDLATCIAQLDAD